MSIYLIDYASVRAGAFDGIELISSEDTVYIYYNLFSSKLSFETLDSLRNSGALVKTINLGFKLFTHPLSVKLAAMLGYLLGCGSSEKIYIVSKRKALSGLFDFAKEYSLGTKVCIAQNIKLCSGAIGDTDTSENKDLSVPSFLRNKKNSL